MCSLWPAPFSYLCVSVMILGVLKTVCGWTSKNWLLPYACCGLHFIDSAACVLSFDHSTPLHKYNILLKKIWIQHIFSIGMLYLAIWTLFFRGNYISVLQASILLLLLETTLSIHLACSVQFPSMIELIREGWLKFIDLTSPLASLHVTGNCGRRMAPMMSVMTESDSGTTPVPGEDRKFT